MKICIACPGTWTYGLNSPERGEGRWAQNFVKMLHKAGHNIVAVSGNSGWEHREERLFLTSERNARQYGPYDLYFDSAWWEGKLPMAVAKKYIHLIFSMEDRHRQPFPNDHIIAFPYVSATPNFLNDGNPNRDRTFCLPTMFCEEWGTAKFDNQRVFMSARGLAEAGNRDTIEPTHWTLAALRQWPLDVLLGGSFDKVFKPEYHPDSVIHKGTISYDKTRNLLRSSKLNANILGPSNILDAAAEGVVTLIWDRCCFFEQIAIDHGVMINSKDPKSVGDVINRLTTDRDLYTMYLSSMQHHLNAHKYSEAIKYFNQMVEKL